MIRPNLTTPCIYLKKKMMENTGFGSSSPLFHFFSFFFSPFFQTFIETARCTEKRRDAESNMMTDPSHSEGQDIAILKQWRLHSCGNTTEATTLQQFIKKKKKKKKRYQPKSA